MGTLYQYFSDKDQVVRAIKQRMLDSMLLAMATAAEESASEGLPAQVRSLLRALLREKAAGGALGPAIMAAMLQIDGRVTVDEALEAARQQIIALLKPHASGLALYDLDAASNTIVHAVDGVLMAMAMRAHVGRPIDDARNVEELARLVQGYLGIAG